LGCEQNLLTQGVRQRTSRPVIVFGINTYNAHLAGEQQNESKIKLKKELGMKRALGYVALSFV